MAAEQRDACPRGPPASTRRPRRPHRQARLAWSARRPRRTRAPAAPRVWHTSPRFGAAVLRPRPPAGPSRSSAHSGASSTPGPQFRAPQCSGRVFFSQPQGHVLARLFAHLSAVYLLPVEGGRLHRTEPFMTSRPVPRTGTNMPRELTKCVTRRQRDSLGQVRAEAPARLCR